MAEQADKALTALHKVRDIAVTEMARLDIIGVWMAGYSLREISANVDISHRGQQAA